MTDLEKQLVKLMSKMILDSSFSLGTYRAVLKRHVKQWQDEVALAESSPEFVELSKHYERMRQKIDLLIDESNVSELLSKFPKGGLLN